MDIEVFQKAYNPKPGKRAKVKRPIATPVDVIAKTNQLFKEKYGAMVPKKIKGITTWVTERSGIG